MSISALVDYVKLSPNFSTPAGRKVRKITIHHAAGNVTVETLGNIFALASRQASSNYGIDSKGRIGLYVDEANRAWTSGNAENDNQADTIEVANDGGAPDWHVSDRAINRLIELCTDICKRNDIKALTYTGDKNGNLTRHNMFQATACPGPYLQSKFPYIAEEVNKRLNNNQRKFQGFNNQRLADELKIYTSEYGYKTTKTNMWGCEVCVNQWGTVMNNPIWGFCNKEIPYKGWVISGHGEASKWILKNLRKGMQVSFDVNTRLLTIH